MRFHTVIRLILGVTIGMILGALLFRSYPAQAQNAQVVIVQEAQLNNVTSVLAGSQVVGFSCVPGVAGSAPRCFVANVSLGKSK
jgi:hypothetical protein